MNSLDIILLLLFLPGLIQGLRKGFLAQGISVAGIVAGVWLAFHYYAALALRLKEHIHTGDTLLNVLAFAVILLLASLLAVVAAKLLTKLVQMATLGWLNRLLGMFFALLTTALTLGLSAVLFDRLNQRFALVSSPILTDSLMYAWLKDLGYTVYPYLQQIVPLTTA